MNYYHMTTTGKTSLSTSTVMKILEHAATGDLVFKMLTSSQGKL